MSDDGCFNDSLEGVYHVAGFTKSGAPYFKRSEPSFKYIYHDPHCDPGGNAAARWIIGSIKPSLTAEHNLHGGSGCNYHARKNTEDDSYPPLQRQQWRALCSGSWQNSELEFLSHVPPPSPPPLPSAPTAPPGTCWIYVQTCPNDASVPLQEWFRDSFGESSANRDPNAAENSAVCTARGPEFATHCGAPGWHVSHQHNAYPPPPPPVVITDGCLSEYEAVYDAVGFTRSGTSSVAPYFESTSATSSERKYIYFDKQCSVGSSARWLISGSKPSETRESNLKGQGNGCGAWAWFEADGWAWVGGAWAWFDDSSPPLGQMQWLDVWCNNGGWTKSAQDVTILSGTPYKACRVVVRAITSGSTLTYTRIAEFKLYYDTEPSSWQTTEAQLSYSNQAGENGIITWSGGCWEQHNVFDNDASTYWQCDIPTTLELGFRDPVIITKYEVHSAGSGSISRPRDWEFCCQREGETSFDRLDFVQYNSDTIESRKITQWNRKGANEVCGAGY